MRHALVQLAVHLFLDSSSFLRDSDDGVEVSAGFNFDLGQADRIQEPLLMSQWVRTQSFMIMFSIPVQTPFMTVSVLCKLIYEDILMAD